MASIIVFSRLVLIIFLLFALPCRSQQLLNLSDEQNISLSIDYIRKGIQQEDIEKILKVCGPTVAVAGKRILSKEDIGGQFQTVFDNSSERKTLLAKPAFDRADNPLNVSDFWDFDILEPKIKIAGDTAVVDCAFVLWGDAEDSGKLGRRVQGQLVFVAFRPLYRPIPPEDEFVSHTPSPEAKNAGIFHDWRLVNIGCLLNFIGGSPKAGGGTNKSGQGAEK